MWTPSTRCRTSGSGRAPTSSSWRPATADLLARAAHGLADDLLTTTLLTARCPVVLAPAMHTEMWDHPATQANVATLRERGVHVIDPASGRLTGADTGPGRLPEPEEIYAVCRGSSPAAAPAQGRSPSLGDVRPGRRPDGCPWQGGVSSSAPAAPVSRWTRCASSATARSGKQGYALAAVAAARAAPT